MVPPAARKAAADAAEHVIVRYDYEAPQTQPLGTGGDMHFAFSFGAQAALVEIDMTTNTRGGLLKGLGRKLAGESLFMTTYTCAGDAGMITFTPEAPGKVLPFRLAAGQSLICQKDAFMCAESSVELEMHFRRRLGTGLFGGEGFILQKITGPGTSFLEIAGEVRAYDLRPVQVLKVDPGHIALYEPTVDYDLTAVRGVANALFGGEGLFLATLTGPGKIWLQSLPLSNLAGKLGSRDRAEEAAQEALVRAYFNIGKLKKPDSFFSWLLGIADNVAKEQQRKEQIQRQREIVRSSLEESSGTELSQDYALETAIAELPEAYRKVILLRYYGQHSCNQIAEQLDMPLGTVTKTLSRAYAMLRELLQQQKQSEVYEVSQ